MLEVFFKDLGEACLMYDRDPGDGCSGDEKDQGGGGDPAQETEEGAAALQAKKRRDWECSGSNSYLLFTPVESV